MMRLDEIGLRDPYILLHEGKYYLYGTRNQTAWGAADGFDVYVSENLQDWEGPFVIFHNDGSFWATESYWAPECIVCQGKFYLIATFGAPNHSKGIQFLKADAPEGPFVPVGEGPVTPKGWNCIDGTFFQDEKGTPWLVFSHSVPEETRGAICALRLSEDLTGSSEEPTVLFYADSAPWARPVPFAKQEFGLDGDVYLSDGPFLFRGDNDELTMLWSSWGEHGYTLGIAESESGLISGPWKQNRNAACSRDGGHGMIFKTKEGKRLLVLHSPNETPKEHPVLSSV